MKDFTFGTLICCLFLAFMLGFLACHKLYNGFEGSGHVDNDFTRWDNASLYWK